MQHKRVGVFWNWVYAFSNLGNNVSNIFSSIGSALSGSSGGGGILGFLGQGGLNFGQLLGGPSNAQLAGTTATAASSVGMSGFGELGRVMASGGFVKNGLKAE